MSPTPSRNVRAGEEWYQAMRRAEEDGLSLGPVIRWFLREYAARRINPGQV